MSYVVTLLAPKRHNNYPGNSKASKTLWVNWTYVIAMTKQQHKENENQTVGEFYEFYPTLLCYA